MLSVPWTNWSYFVAYHVGIAYVVWTPSSAANGSGLTGTPNRDFGTVNLDIQVPGTYTFSCEFAMRPNCGIATFTINGVVTTIDTYNAADTLGSHQWSQVLSAGVYTIDLSTLTKNSSSTNYWLYLAENSLSIRRTA
jgi:hypothetical protein